MAGQTSDAVKLSSCWREFCCQAAAGSGLGVGKAMVSS
jgi:hypothetical protein